MCVLPLSWIPFWNKRSSNSFKYFIEMLSIQNIQNKRTADARWGVLMKDSLWLGSLWWSLSLKEVRALLPGLVAIGCELSYTPTFKFEWVRFNTKHLWFVFKWTYSNDREHVLTVKQYQELHLKCTIDRGDSHSKAFISSLLNIF